MKTTTLLKKAQNGEKLNLSEGIFLYENAPLNELIESAHNLRMQIHPEKKAGWIIDRNVNITNICFSFCKFCNFCRKNSAEDGYITSLDEYRQKIHEMQKIGGDQLLLQGGMHPKLGLEFYTDLFSSLKKEFPDIKLHTLGPPEVVHIANMAGLSYHDTLLSLQKAGMDSLPGAGAEILVDRVREIVSPAKCSTDEWLEVMRVAHQINLPTSATMMFGHVETMAERVEHLIRIRNVQDEVPAGHYGFLNFIPWPFMDEGTTLLTKYNISNQTGARDYIRLIALSRLILVNIPNIQASWLTVGQQTGQVCLHAGANDFGSIMIEENVVSSAGANYKMDADGIQQCIRDAGFTPKRRNQLFEDFIPPEN
ncbi:MAG: dehypoxanthine futalosine cyclase [Bacteroidales bacterium]|nr:dehypoxanthine futalosine cyclase [Bacteroidales bacterium]